MTDYFDASVLIAAIVVEEPSHHASLEAWQQADARVMLLHGVVEAFASLTGGKKPHLRLSPDVASHVLSENIHEFGAEIIGFQAVETLDFLKDSRRFGIRGGAVYDYLHLCAARKGGAERIFTLNKRHFAAIAPDLVPRIYHPAELF